MDRSTSIDRLQHDTSASSHPASRDDEPGWWMPHPPGLIIEDSDVHLRHLLGEDGPLRNGTLLRRLVPAQLRKALEKSSRCDRVSKVENLTYLTSGWTKAVYRGQFEDREVAVKVVDKGGYDVRRCVKTKGMTLVECQQDAENKILKEGFILKTLDNPHIVRLLDVCVTSAEVGSQLHSGSSLVTELGETADIIKLLQMSWENRLRLSFGLSKLLHYLANTRYGSIVVNDFRRQQFVVIGGELKLIDVDDVGFDELTCFNNDDCKSQLTASNITINVPCSSGRCVGLNELKNTINAGRHFMGLLLPHGAPNALRPLVNRIVDAYTDATLGATELLDLTTKLVQLYTEGFYLQRGTEPIHTTYRKIDESDLPGQFDYRCRYSIATSGCTVSVFDEQEAEDLCDFDTQCQAFVISSEKTWTGRLTAHLKNNISTPTTRAGMKLYVRQRS